MICLMACLKGKEHKSYNLVVARSNFVLNQIENLLVTPVDYALLSKSKKRRTYEIKEQTNRKKWNREDGPTV